MHEVLRDILTTGRIRTPDGEEIAIDASAVPPAVGSFLASLIRQHDPTTVVEVGLGFGMSAMFIADARVRREGSRHVVIDPYQMGEHFRGLGLLNLERMGYTDVVDFRPEPSYRALAALETGGCRADLIFLDGCHHFDAVMADVSLSDRILNVGGLLVLDDANMPQVRRVCRFIASNLAYTVVACVASTLRSRFFSGGRRLIIPSPRGLWLDARYGLVMGSRCIAFRKVRDDDRDWHHFRRF